MNQQSVALEPTLFPYPVKETQEWFAGLITSPLGENDAIQTYSPAGFLVEEEASRYIAPSPTLKPHERLQIYNQQYWWRMLNSLQTNFPLVTRLFGRCVFNEKIAIPYLLKCPPHHWSLSSIGDRLSNWIQEYYQEPDKNLIHHSASLDWAFTSNYLAPSFPPLDLAKLIQTNSDDLLNVTFYLQPHIHLFQWDYDLLTFREHFLEKDADYWIEHPFPDLPKGNPFRFILYRNANNHAAWREISRPEFLLLECFSKGSSTLAACEYLESQEASVYEEAVAYLQGWLQEWTQLGWLTERSSKIDAKSGS